MMKLQSIRWFCLMLVVASIYLSACASAGGGQSSIVNIDSLIQAKSFVFIPQSVSPVGGRTRQLNADFALTVSADTVVSYLPYFGRSYTAPIGTGRGAMDFTLTPVNYTTQQQGDGWNITIQPAQSADIRELQLQVFSNGKASLQALSNVRQSISYNGYIQPRRRR